MRTSRSGAIGRVELDGAGVDLARLRDLLARPELRGLVIEGVETLVEALPLDGCPVPRLAIVRGPCGAAGLALLDACELRLATIALSGVDRVVPEADLERVEAEMWAEILGDRPARVIHAVMRALHGVRTLPREAALAAEASLFSGLLRYRPGPVRSAVCVVEHAEVPHRSLAGALALKRAVVEVYADLVPGVAIGGLHVEHLDDGTPLVRGAPGIGRLFVSISHTRTRSHALASLQLDEP